MARVPKSFGCLPQRSGGRTFAEEGIFVMKDYDGLGEDRVLFSKLLDP
jgi:hypothetical protein